MIRSTDVFFNDLTIRNCNVKILKLIQIQVLKTKISF